MKNSRGLNLFLVGLSLACVIAGPVKADDDAKKIHKQFMQEAIKEARKSLAEGATPVGAVLAKEGKIIGRGHNRRAQKGSAGIHAEIDCLQNADSLAVQDCKNCILYTTLSPCDMSADAILLHKIPIVAIGENETFKGPEKYLKSRGVELIDLDMEECKDMMEDFIKKRSQTWDED